METITTIPKIEVTSWKGSCVLTTSVVYGTVRKYFIDTNYVELQTEVIHP